MSKEWAASTKKRPKTTAFKKKVKKLFPSPIRAITIQAARNQNKLLVMREETKVLKLVKKGHTFEEVAEILSKEPGREVGVSPKNALDLTKAAIARWCGELALDAKECRELDLKRLDAIQAILWTEIEPHELKDDRGRVIIDAATLEPAMSRPDHNSIKLCLEIMSKRARLLGLESDEAAVKVVNEVNIIERRYVGADPDAL